jgi:protein-disulfide isomerase
MSKQGRDHSRAKRIVEAQRAAERRRKVTLWTTIAVVLVLVASGLVGWAVMANQSSDTASKVTVPPVAVDSGTAFAVGDGPVVIDLYEDFMCPICHEFETESGPTLAQLAAQHKVTLRYHPIAILDRASSGTEYSTRSAGAAAAAAVGGKFIEYHDVLYANQPAENSTGLTNAKLIDLGKSVGLTSAAFADAINNKTYTAWATQVTDTAAANGVNGTPTVKIAGKVVTESNGGPPTPATLTTAVTAAAG